MSRALLVVVALTLASASPAVAGTVVDNPNFVLGSVPYEFSTATNTFSGVQTGGFLAAPVLDGDVTGTLSVTFTDPGAFVGGTFQLTGEIASLGIPPASLLMQGVVTGVSTIMDLGEHFFVPFNLEIDTVHPLLGFAAETGSWHAFVFSENSGECPGCPSSIGELFTTDYTDAAAPLNTNVLSSHHVPHPAAALLLGFGLALLAARQRLHWCSPAETT